jgi:hypothetical protein
LCWNVERCPEDTSTPPPRFDPETDLPKQGHARGARYRVEKGAWHGALWRGTHGGARGRATLGLGVQRGALGRHTGGTLRRGPAGRMGVWMGWSCLRTKLQAPWHEGVSFYLLPSFGDAFYTKSPRRPRQVPGQLPNRLEVIHKNASGWFYK